MTQDSTPDSTPQSTSAKDTKSAAKNRLPKVAIIGRPNVGKSSLLNLLAGRRVSIVDPTEGVTRDRVSTVATLHPMYEGQPTRYLEIIDTGGYGISDSQNLTKSVERQIAMAVQEADIILFVIDAQTGVMALDIDVARLLRQGRAKGKTPGSADAIKAAKVPVLLIANKVDGPRHEADAYEATRLGFGEPIPVSASTQYRKHELFEVLREKIDFDAICETNESPNMGILMAVVGKRNAGKSTFVNALAGEERVIVSEVEGTTRDSVDVRFEMDNEIFTAIDTAGVRKTKSLDGDIEYYSHHRSLRSIRRADVVVFFIDASVPISQVDKQLGNEVLEHYKPAVIVVNKWDLAEKNYTEEEYVEYLDKNMKGLSFAPIIFVSSVQNRGVRDVVAMALNLHQQACHRMGTSELNRIVHELLDKHQPSSPHGHSPKIYYVTQLATNPPTIGLFVNDPTMFDPTYQRFLINRFRETLPFSEVPIKLLLRGKKGAPGEA